MDPAQDAGLLGQGNSRSKRLQYIFQMEKLRESLLIIQNMYNQSQQIATQKSLCTIQRSKDLTPLAFAARRRAST